MFSIGCGSGSCQSGRVQFALFHVRASCIGVRLRWRTKRLIIFRTERDLISKFNPATTMELLAPLIDASSLQGADQRIHQNDILRNESGAPLFLLLRGAGLVAAAVHLLSMLPRGVLINCIRERNHVQTWIRSWIRGSHCRNPPSVSAMLAVRTIGVVNSLWSHSITHLGEAQIVEMSALVIEASQPAEAWSSRVPSESLRIHLHC